MPNLNFLSQFVSELAGASTSGDQILGGWERYHWLS